MAQAKNLEDLRDSVVPHHQSGDAADTGTASWTVDVRLLERLLLFESAGQRNDETDGSLHSRDLKPRLQNTHNKSNASASFDLIGSVGISGHQSVPKDTPISAPLMVDRVNQTHEADLDFFANMTPEISGFEGYLDYQGVSSNNGVEGNSNMFLPANEYGRSIDDWLGVNLL